jgi:hypothetical protein
MSRWGGLRGTLFCGGILGENPAARLAGGMVPWHNSTLFLPANVPHPPPLAMKSNPLLLSLLALLCLLSAAGDAATYYVANKGSDAALGTSPEAPWKTIARVNATKLAPGDAVLLKRGDRWREQLDPQSGSEGRPITYGAYGSGEKPLLLGSVSKSTPGDWRHEGGSIWVAGELTSFGDSLLANPSFSENTATWSLHVEPEAKATADRDAERFDSAPAGYRVQCTTPGKAGSHMQLIVTPVAIAKGKLYRLVFRAKATEPFQLQSPNLMHSGAPWSSYSWGPKARANRIGKDWATYTQYYRANTDDARARLTFFLGGVLPAGATFHLDTLSFQEVSAEGALFCDVGNIIFNHETVCGVKKFNESELKEQGEYWYDEDNCTLKLYSTKSPAEYYSDIECALRRHIIDESNTSYAIYDGLALKYGAAHGIGGHNTHHVTMRNCDLGYIGGGDQRGGDHTVRFGNGVEYWSNAHDNLVENCRLWEIYDAAITNQSLGEPCQQYNLVYRNNVIWNCEYSFEYWNRPAESLTYNMIFENNTCINAGGGWGHSQRPDPNGRHLCFYTSPAQAHDIHIRNNIFYQCMNNAFFLHHWPEAAIRELDMGGNCWYQPEGDMVRLIGPNGGEKYPMGQFAAFKTKHQPKDDSVAADPKMTAPARGEYRLRPDSPCPGAGAMPIKSK